MATAPSASSSKANDYAIDALKLILTLAGGTLALSITFLKDVIGTARDQAIAIWLVPCSWVFFLVSITLAWLAIVAAADELGRAATDVYAFRSERRGDPKPSWYVVLAWFYPWLKIQQQNEARKIAASAQNHFLLALFLLGLFAVLNLTLHETRPPVAAENSTRSKHESPSAEVNSSDVAPGPEPNTSAREATPEKK
jgi:hypothetical protein